MRVICWSVLSLGLLIQNPGAEGQDSPRPALPGVPTKKAEPKAIVIDEEALPPGTQILRAGKLPPGTPQPGGGLDGTIDRLIKDLEDLRREMKKTKEAANVQGEPKREFKPGGLPGFQGKPGPMPGQPGFPPGGPGPMPGQPGFAPGGSHVDQKLDMILKQMDEMRKDIKDLQNRLPAAKEKKGPPFAFNGYFGPKGPMKDTKPSPAPETPPQLKENEWNPDVALQKAMQLIQEHQREAENMMLKQHIDRLLQEVEKLRNEIRKANPAK